MLNQTADELSIKLFIRGLKIDLESKRQCGWVWNLSHAWQESERKEYEILRSQSRKNTLLRLHASRLDEVEQIGSSQVVFLENVNC